MNTGLKIAIVDSSLIIRTGLSSLLKRLPGFQFSIVEITEPESFLESIRIHKPDILIINPQMSSYLPTQKLREECEIPELKIIALLSNLCPDEQLKVFDEQITIYDDIDQIRTKLEHIISAGHEETSETNEEQQLSDRENEIVVCVVKGMTNREIAESLYLSAHTVVTHRRNIARKLQIHSTSGLTIYAIMNKLVNLKDI